MSTICKEPIVAIACEDKNKDFHVFHCEKPISFEDVQIKDKFVKANELLIVLEPFESVIVCTESYLKQLREKITNA